MSVTTISHSLVDQCRCRRKSKLWAEVFHVSASGAGTVKWQQVSEDLVPVNITCIQDSPECVFHITAYNSQVDKILDVRLVQPGTRIGQASECFVYWKDPMTNDTWGLNFTSPIDAKQFRECCSPSFKFSRKASSSYSLKLEPPNKQNKVKTKRKPLSTPASPSRSREPQCTCMTADQYARLRAQDPRYRGSSTLPRAQSRVSDVADGRVSTLGDKVTAATSSTSLYDNVSGRDANKTLSAGNRQTRDRETSTPGGKLNTSNHATTQVPAQSQTEEGQETSKSEGTQAGGTVSGGKMTTGTCTPRLTKDTQSNTQHKASGGPDYGDGNDMVREAELRAANNNNNNINNLTSNSRSRNTNNNNNKMGKDDIRSGGGGGISVDSNTLKRMLKPMPSLESPVTSPEMTRRRYNYYNHHGNMHYNHHGHSTTNNNARHVLSEPETMSRHKSSRFSECTMYWLRS